MPGGWGSQISRKSAHKGCQPYAPAAFNHQEIFVVLIFVRGWVDPMAIMRPEGLCQWKIPVTPSGIEPSTIRLVAQCLNQACPTSSNMKVNCAKFLTALRNQPITGTPSQSELTVIEITKYDDLHSFKKQTTQVSYLLQVSTTISWKSVFGVRCWKWLLKANHAFRHYLLFVLSVNTHSAVFFVPWVTQLHMF
jgi:hypothetical protein